MTSPAPRVAVVGTGYVGTVAAACLAALDREVIGLEIDRRKLETLNDGRVPFFEPGLEELLVAGLSSGRLRFTDDAADAVGSSDVIFLSVGTPSTTAGHADTSAVEAAARAIVREIREPKVLVTKSTVPIGTNQWLRSLAEE